MDDAAAPPLATIVIPTFNRYELLKRAVASALAQDYPAIEVLIVDNASEDATEDVCRDLAAADCRIRYMRQLQNVGPVRNFETGLENARGHYFMWLADDDWISSDYVRLCAAELEGGHHALVVGRDYWHFREGALAEPVVSALAESPKARILTYLGSVSSNSAVYGLCRTQMALSCLPFPRPIGGDMSWVVRLLAQGTLAVVTDVELHRDPGGVSWDFHEVARQFGHGGWTIRYPRLMIAVNIFTTMARNPPSRDSSHSVALAVKASLVTAVHIGSFSELTSPVRLFLQHSLPKGLYATLRCCYRPIRGLQTVARSVIIG